MKTMKINESLIYAFFYALKIPPATIFIVKPMVLLRCSLFALPAWSPKGGHRFCPGPQTLQNKWRSPTDAVNVFVYRRRLGCCGVAASDFFWSSSP